MIGQTVSAPYGSSVHILGSMPLPAPTVLDSDHAAVDLDLRTSQPGDIAQTTSSDTNPAHARALAHGPLEASPDRVRLLRPAV